MIRRHAPFLFPHPHTLAYTEPLIGVALFVAPIEWRSRCGSGLSRRSSLV